MTSHQVKQYCQHCKKADVPLIIISRSPNGIIYRMCRVCNTERAKKYRATKEGKAKIYAAVYRSIENHREKQTAREKLNQAVKKGEIIPEPCHCGLKAEAHHDDYSKPLKVKWLCRSHHASYHKRVKVFAIA